MVGLEEVKIIDGWVEAQQSRKALANALHWSMIYSSPNVGRF